jgi:hypothetical protein
LEQVPFENGTGSFWNRFLLEQVFFGTGSLWNNFPFKMVKVPFGKGSL